jgi:hypothetical protein
MMGQKIRLKINTIPADSKLYSGIALKTYEDISFISKPVRF